LGSAGWILGFRDTDSLIILTTSFAKKTQKTPERDIKLAVQRKRDHPNRKTRR
jgi:phage-related protein